MLIGWKAWVATQYGFTRYNSLQHKWEDVPKDGMLALRTYESELKSNKTPVGFKFLGCDYYFMARRDKDVEKEIEKRYPGAIIRRGKWTDVVTFELARKEMEAAANWP